MGRLKYYVVARGREVGVFDSWVEAEASVLNYPGNLHKSFDTRCEAESWLIANRDQEVQDEAAQGDVVERAAKRLRVDSAAGGSGSPLGAGLAAAPPSAFEEVAEAQLNASQKRFLALVMAGKNVLLSGGGVARVC